MSYWLLKSEPSTFSIEHLIASPNKTTSWDGVRNYQARNYLKLMKKNELAFFYHSNCAVPSIVGIVKITSEFYPDATAFDIMSPYYDSKSTSENPRWFVVGVEFVRTLNDPIPLFLLKENPLLKELPLVKKGSRLSVMPVSENEWNSILDMENYS